MSAPTAVRERPILFSGPMVRAILDGKKTQTRRVVSDATSVGNYKASELRLADAWVDGSKLKAYLLPEVAARVGEEPDAIIERLYCRYGDVGDRLWVRETLTRSGGYAQYAANHETSPHLWPAEWKQDPRPSIHMPRWASRITLEITEVRVERLQAITANDCIAEGIPSRGIDRDGPCIASAIMYIEDYKTLWDSLNASRGYGWDANPFVWVIEFKRVVG